MKLNFFAIRMKQHFENFAIVIFFNLATLPHIRNLNKLCSEGENFYDGKERAQTKRPRYNTSEDIGRFFAGIGKIPITEFVRHE